MAVDEVSFSISQGTLPRQVATDYVGRNRPPNHTFDLSSRAVREISAYTARSATTDLLIEVFYK